MLGPPNNHDPETRHIIHETIIIMKPAVDAEANTPAMFGPIACIKTKLDGSSLLTIRCATLELMGTAETPAIPTTGLKFPPVKT